MKQVESTKSAIILILVAVLVLSWFQFPPQERTYPKKNVSFQISENTDIEDGVPLRSIAEDIPEIENSTASIDYFSAELFYSSIIKVQLYQKQFENSHFESYTKRYLMFLRILI